MRHIVPPSPSRAPLSARRFMACILETLCSRLLYLADSFYFCLLFCVVVNICSCSRRCAAGFAFVGQHSIILAQKFVKILHTRTLRQPLPRHYCSAFIFAFWFLFIALISKSAPFTLELFLFLTFFGALIYIPSSESGNTHSEIMSVLLRSYLSALTCWLWKTISVSWHD